MGIRPVQGIVLLGLFFLATSLSMSCNREPEPTAIDISQPQKHQPPAELWRKRVVNKPLSPEKLDQLQMDMDYDKLAKANGWTLGQSPILLPDGNILCVTSNMSLDTGNSSSRDWTDPSNLFIGETMFRLIIVSKAGKIKVHKEFPWDMLTRVVPDPADEYLAFVVEKLVVICFRNRYIGLNKLSILNQTIVVIPI